MIQFSVQINTERFLTNEDLLVHEVSHANDYVVGGLKELRDAPESRSIDAGNLFWSKKGIQFERRQNGGNYVIRPRQ